MNLQPFEYYLKTTQLAESTIHGHLSDIRQFMVWSKENDLNDVERITYTELLTYVQYLKQRKLTVATINIRLNSLRKYFEHLKQEGYIEVNPARKMHIKGRTKSVVINPLSYTELEELYHHYTKPREFYREQKSREVHERNSIILGLIIWQGAHSGEIAKLESEHINLNEGTIYIPSTSRSNSRQIKLEVKQIISLHQYMTTRNFKSNESGQTLLFTDFTHNTMTYLMQEIKGINPQIRSPQHIRASVILHWLKMYDKRTVQHMLGFKHISSVETYEVQELTELTDLLSKHHPFS